MIETTPLFEMEPVVKLTARQQHALDAIEAAGYDGITTDELGAAIHGHDDTICEWCPSAGREVGSALRRKGLVKQRRVKAAGRDAYMVWVRVGVKAERPVYELPEEF